jgi:hypothetical protein
MDEVQKARVDKIMALAEAWRTAGGREEHAIREDHLRGAIEALLEQPEPVPLTDEQADLLINGRGEHGDDDYVEPTGDGFGLTDGDLVKLIRRVEAHHGIGVKP